MVGCADLLPGDVLRHVFQYCRVRSASLLGCTCSSLKTLAEERAVAVIASDPGMDAEVAAFFAPRRASLVERAWLAEAPRRFHRASRKRWLRVAGPPPRCEGRQVEEKRLIVLGLRLHRLARAITGGSLPQLRAEFALGLDLNAALRGYGFPEAPAGRTPLQAACLTGRADVVSWMLARGADVHARDGDGRRAVDLVRDRLHFEPRLAAVEELLAAAAASDAAAKTSTPSPASLAPSPSSASSRARPSAARARGGAASALSHSGAARPVLERRAPAGTFGRFFGGAVSRACVEQGGTGGGAGGGAERLAVAARREARRRCFAAATAMG